MTTPFQQHFATWRYCTACELHEGRKYVVLARGKVPCDILFVGEAPGESEDTLGVPFIGPAGKLLDQIIKTACDGLEYRTCFTNLVCCIPRDDNGAKATGEPPEEAIQACSGRLVEMVHIAKPKLLVCVGKLPDKWLRDVHRFSIDIQWKCHMTTIDHPAYMLRIPIVNRGLAMQRNAIVLRSAIEQIGKPLENPPF